MKSTLSLKRNFLSFSLAISAVICGQLSARAEAVNTASQPTIAKFTQPSDRLSEQFSDAMAKLPTPTATGKTANATFQIANTSVPALDVTTQSAISSSPVVPVPGTTSTTASSLRAQATPTAPEATPTTPAPTTPEATPTTPEATPSTTPQPAPAQEAAPATLETRYQFSYLGAGVNLGFGTDSALGDISFAAYSKFALNPYISFRPAILVSSDLSFLFPVTYEFPITGPGRGVVPYIGTGLMFSTGEDSNVDLLLSAGLDFPINSQLTATAGVNIGPFDGVDVGFLVGLAYNFSARTVTTPAVSVGNAVNNAADTAANAVTGAANTAANAVTGAANTAENAIENALPANRRRVNPSYFGVGVNLGVTGPTALGDVSFAVLSKIALNSYISVRPSVLISNDATFLIPVTYDFPTFRTEFLSFAPYLGAGLAVSTSDDSNVDLLLSAGVDIPITREIAFTSSLNVTPLNNVDIGFLLGVVYTFGGF